MAIGIADVVAIGKDIPAVEVIDLAVEIVVDAIGRIIVHPQAAGKVRVRQIHAGIDKSDCHAGGASGCIPCYGRIDPRQRPLAGIFGIIGDARRTRNIVWFGILDRSVGGQGRHRVFDRDGRCPLQPVDTFQPDGAAALDLCCIDAAIAEDRLCRGGPQRRQKRVERLGVARHTCASSVGLPARQHHPRLEFEEQRVGRVFDIRFSRSDDRFDGGRRRLRLCRRKGEYRDGQPDQQHHGGHADPAGMPAKERF